MEVPNTKLQGNPANWSPADTMRTDGRTNIMELITGLNAQLKPGGITAKAVPYTGLGRPSRLQEVESPGNSRQSAHEVGKLASPTRRPSLPQDIPLLLIIVKG
jgi:hypothetical protein